jgi:putative hydrolase of the HAD superfamily
LVGELELAHKKAVVFDLGNVVLDWNIDRILSSMSLEPAERNSLRAELFMHNDWVDLDHGKHTEKSVVAKVCARSSLSRETVENALSAARYSLSEIEETIHLMREISDKGIRMYCLSNMSRETYDHIKDNSFFTMFSGVLISGMEGCIKPNEDIFHLLLDRFDLNPVNTIFIDDSIANVETANRLGIHGFHFKRSSNCYSGIRDLLF